MDHLDRVGNVDDKLTVVSCVVVDADLDVDTVDCISKKHMVCEESCELRTVEYDTSNRTQPDRVMRILISAVCAGTIGCLDQEMEEFNFLESGRSQNEASAEGAALLW